MRRHENVRAGVHDVQSVHESLVHRRDKLEVNKKAEHLLENREVEFGLEDGLVRNKDFWDDVIDL